MWIWCAIVGFRYDKLEDVRFAKPEAFAGKLVRWRVDLSSNPWFLGLSMTSSQNFKVDERVVGPFIVMFFLCLKNKRLQSSLGCTCTLILNGQTEGMTLESTHLCLKYLCPDRSTAEGDGFILVPFIREKDNCSELHLLPAMNVEHGPSFNSFIRMDPSFMALSSRFSNGSVSSLNESDPKIRCLHLGSKE